MYILKNALKNITRSKGRNILIGVIIVIIAASSCVALSIKNSAAEIVSSYEESFEVTASLGIDREAMRAIITPGAQGDMRNLMNSIASPGIEEIKEYGDSGYVTSYTYTLTASMNSTTIEPLTNEEAAADSSVSDDAAGSENGNTPGGGNTNPGGGGFPLGSRGDFTLIGYSSLDAMNGFISGTYQIVEGAMFEDGETGAVCVISDELALDNDLAVGDAITLSNPADDTEVYDIIVAGFYKDAGIDDSSMNWFSNSANQIITNYTAAAGIAASSATLADAAQTAAAATETTDDDTVIAAVGGQLATTFYLSDTSKVDALEAEMKAKGLSEYYTLTTNESSLEETLRPITNLNTFANLFILIVLLVGGTILLAVNMINIRERKYEVGVLRAIGMKKSRLAMQFVAELLIVTFMSIIIGTAAGAAVSVPAAETLLKNEIESIQTDQSQVAQNFGRPGEDGAQFSGRGGLPGGGREILGGVFNQGQNIDYISQINAVISFKVILELILIGIVLTLSASIISIVLIARYEPLKILSNRSS
ncbi:MAG: ABC transporter permease [Saccharofermentanales bacterium]